MQNASLGALRTAVRDEMDSSSRVHLQLAEEGKGAYEKGRTIYEPNSSLSEPSSRRAGRMSKSAWHGHPDADAYTSVRATASYITLLK